MNFTDYSLQKLAQGYLLQDSKRQEALRLLSRAVRDERTHHNWDQFGLLLQSWLRLTSLLVRYPIEPARVRALLVSVGFPAAAQARTSGR